MSDAFSDLNDGKVMDSSKYPKLNTDETESSGDVDPLIVAAAAHFDTTDPDAVKAFNEYVEFLAQKYKKAPRGLTHAYHEDKQRLLGR